MSVKISIEFAPIFDLNPGLDANGFMTSPVYNTGDTIKVLTEMPEERAESDATRTTLNRATAASQTRTENGGTTNGSGAVGSLS
jgi:hypothetical protein